jgi:hypothetical protein
LVEGDNFYIEGRNNWTQLFDWKSYNWITFDFFHARVEYEKIFYNNFNASLALFGFGIYIQYSVPSEEQVEEMKEFDNMLEETTKAHDAIESIARRLAASGELQRGMVLEAQAAVEILDRREEERKEKGRLRLRDLT